jgi:hypothetical protein
MRKDLFVLAVLGCGALPVLAGPQCTAHTTRGFWAATCDGYLAPAPGASLQPARLLSTCTTSRSAFWDCEGTVNVGGQILPQELHGQAFNNENCTGTITYIQTIFGQPAPDLNIRYVILDGGDTIKGLPIDPGQVLSCVLNRISRHEGH